MGIAFRELLTVRFFGCAVSAPHNDGSLSVL
jgi:hypothetical protein